jgi:1-acyl-sn-glycerol-3-phosphate acyltransferase
MTFYDYIRVIVVTPPLALVGSMTVFGLETLRPYGGFILAVAHDSWFDSLWLARAIAPRRVHFMAKKELFNNPAVNWYLRKVLAFPVDRSNLSRDTIRYSVELLSRGELIGIFPNGTRTFDPKRLRLGCCIISVISGRPIIPAARVVAHRRGICRLRPVHKVGFGDPIYPCAFSSVKTLRADAKEMSERLAVGLLQLRWSLEG